MWTAYLAAKQGLDVTLVDAGKVPNPNAPSAGDTRVFRMAYFEDSNYVPFLKEARRMWGELEKETGRQLFEPTGVLMAGPADSELVSGAKKAIDQHDIDAVAMSRGELEATFGGFRFLDGDEGVFDREGGFLYAGEAYRALCELVRKQGVCVIEDSPATHVESSGSGARIEGPGLFGEEHRHTVVCIGPGFHGFDINGHKANLRVSRQVLTYWNLGGAWTTDSVHPVFAFQEDDGRFYYGFPGNRASLGIKIALHTEGESGDREPDERDTRPIEDWISKRMRVDHAWLAETQVCHYDIAGDGHIAFGRFLGTDRIGVVGSMSGHGFKFAPALARTVLRSLISDDNFGLMVDIPEKFSVKNLFSTA